MLWTTDTPPAMFVEMMPIAGSDRVFFMWGLEGPDAPKTFAERLDQAWKTSTLTPDKVHGRNVWIAEKLREMGTPVAPESVRKWFAGLTHPRGETLENVAKIIGVSDRWLETGEVPGQPAEPVFVGDIEPDDEASLFNLDLAAASLDHADKQRERERAESAAAAAYVGARLMFAGLATRAKDDRVLIDGDNKTREVAVSLLHKAANKGGLWMARLPEQNSGFPPLTAPFDILVFVLPRGGREPFLFPILNVAAARLGAGGSMIQILEDGAYDEPVLVVETRKGSRVPVSPMIDLATLERLAS